MQELVYFYPEGHQAHFEPGHPERPDRVTAVVNGLHQLDLWQPFLKIPPMAVDETLLSSVHDPAYLAHLKRACFSGLDLDADTFTTPETWRLALQAVGGGLAVAQEVWLGRSRCGFALTRPPGHHATRSYGMGFCLLNNIAFAAEYLLHDTQPGLQRGPLPGLSQDIATGNWTGLLSDPTHPEKLAIIDLDLHHGNGTQSIFYSNPQVMFISTHQSPLFPYTGMLEETGDGPGVGFNMNIPLPPGTGDEGYLAVMDELILPQLSRFQPQMLLVSLGFDPHWMDPFGHIQLSAQGFYLLLQRLNTWAKENCEGKIALFLEGGYDLDAAAACAQAVVCALLGRDWADPLGPSPRKGGFSWRSVLQNAKQIWMF